MTTQTVNLVVDEASKTRAIGAKIAQTKDAQRKAALQEHRFARAGVGSRSSRPGMVGPNGYKSMARIAGVQAAHTPAFSAAPKATTLREVAKSNVGASVPNSQSVSVSSNGSVDTSGTAKTLPGMPGQPITYTVSAQSLKNVEKPRSALLAGLKIGAAAMGDPVALAAMAIDVFAPGPKKPGFNPDVQQIAQLANTSSASTVALRAAPPRSRANLNNSLAQADIVLNGKTPGNKVAALSVAANDKVAAVRPQPRRLAMGMNGPTFA